MKLSRQNADANVGRRISFSGNGLNMTQVMADREDLYTGHPEELEKGKRGDQEPVRRGFRSPSRP
jgi:hypothetical protein